MTFWQGLSIAIGILILSAVIWLMWKDATGREHERQQRELKEQERDERRRTQDSERRVRDAEIVEMMRHTGHAMRSVTELCHSTIKYLDEEGGAARQHYNDSIESFFQAHKERQEILRKLEN